MSFLLFVIQFFSDVNAAFISATIVVSVAALTGLVVNWASKIIAESIDEEQNKRRKAEVLLKEALNQAEFYKDILAHDISNILQNILSASYFIDTNQEGEIKQKINKGGEMKNMIKEQVERGAKLISNVRSLSLIEKHEVSFNTVEIISTLQTSIEFLQNSYQDKKINIQVNSEQKKFNIQGNVLTQDLFENILINAVRHNKNDVNIEIKVSTEMQNNSNHCKIEFIDNGVGISE